MSGVLPDTPCGRTKGRATFKYVAVMLVPIIAGCESGHIRTASPDEVRDCRFLGSIRSKAPIAREPDRAGWVAAEAYQAGGDAIVYVEQYFHDAADYQHGEVLARYYECD